jgi:hypothetical protein
VVKPHSRCATLTFRKGIKGCVLKAQSTQIFATSFDKARCIADLWFMDNIEEHIRKMLLNKNIFLLI